jgi:YD repeat-containing protein
MRAIFFILLGLFAARLVMAQSSYDDPNSIATPSANNNLIKLQDFDVSLYTGAPNINIPLYTLPSRSLNVPISLLYTSTGGIKVQDVANFVGLGWHLNAGGCISRVVRGLPDEQANGYIGINLYGQTIAAGLTSTVFNQIGNGQFDGEPDLFIVSTPYFSCHFVLDQYGNPVFADNNGLKISHNLYENENYAAGTSWVITDANGTQYYFGSTASSREGLTTKVLGQTASFTSTWYLDKVVSFNSKDVITLTYTAGADYSVNHFMNSLTTFTTSTNCANPGNISSSWQIVYTYNAPKYINTISSSQGQVVFSYAFDRQDFTNAARLTSAVISSTANTSLSSPALVKSYQFNYSYFGGSTTDPNALRLCLNSIQLSGNGTDPALTYKSFTYNTSVNLPARNSVEFDYWGYYNTNSTGTTLVPTANKNPDPNRMGANILTVVHELSGAQQQFYFTPNTYYNGTSNMTAGGLRIDHISKVSPSGETLTTQYTYTDGNGHSTGQLYGLAYGNFQRAVGLLVYNGETWCASEGTSTVSESLYDSYDLNGNVVGYSWAKVTSPNGGYEINTFTNYSDFQDAFISTTSDGSAYVAQNTRQICTGTSQAYKRGLLLTKTVYTASNNPVSGTVNVYSPLDAQTSKALGVRVVPDVLLIGANVSSWIYGTYTNYVENYFLTQTTQTTYDELNPTTLAQSVVYKYTYAANHRLIQKTNYIDSRQLPRTKTNYYTEDKGIPNLTGDEQVAINNLLAANNTNAVIHSVEVRNGSTVNTHFSYLNFIDAGMSNNVFLASKKTYLNNNSDGVTQQYQYDPATDNQVAVNKLGGPFLSTLYGYNQTCMTAKARNALSATSIGVAQTTGSNQIAFPPNQLGLVQNGTLVVGYSGTMTITLRYEGTTGPGAWISTVSYTITANDGSYSHGGSLCLSTNNSCSMSNTYTTTTLNPGTYQLQVTTSTSANTAAAAPYFFYTFPQNYTTQQATNEFFYEGFEELSTAATATPCAGLRYNAGAYTVPFVMPNSRQYQVDYHYLSNGVWVPMTRAYTNNMVLSDGSGIDEVRVYPTDAQINTYTYSPLVGVTSKCDERNRLTFYDYDGFGRLLDSRDNDGNLLKVYNYQYNVTPQ